MRIKSGRKIEGAGRCSVRGSMCGAVECGQVNSVTRMSGVGQDMAGLLRKMVARRWVDKREVARAYISPTSAWNTISEQSKGMIIRSSMPRSLASRRNHHRGWVEFALPQYLYHFRLCVVFRKKRPNSLLCIRP